MNVPSRPGARRDGVQLALEPCVAQLVRLARDGPWVRVAGAVAETRARRLRSVSLDELRTALASGEAVLVALEQGDPARPIIVGILATESATPNLDEVLAPAAPARPTEAVVDGQRVVIEGQREVVLRCGKASITLQRDGKVVVRGTQVVTHADGRLRLRGGKVEVN